MRKFKSKTTIGKHKPTKKASYTASKLVTYLKKGGYILSSRLSLYFLFSFSTMQCTTNFDLPPKRTSQAQTVLESLKLSVGEKDGSHIPITVQLQCPRGGEPETVTVFYDSYTDTFFDSEGKPLCEELLASTQDISIYRGAYKQSTNEQDDRAIIVEVYSDTNELLESAALDKPALLADLGANKEQDDTNKGVGPSPKVGALDHVIGPELSNGNTKEREPLRQQEAKNITTTSIASSPKKPAPSENEKMEDDNSVEAQKVEMSLDNEGYLKASGLEALNIRLCTTPSQSVPKKVVLIDSESVSGHPTYLPVGTQKRVIRQANICVRIFLKEDYKSAYSGQYVLVYNRDSFTLESNSSALLILGPTTDNSQISRNLGTLQVKLGDKIIKAPLPVLYFSN